MEIKDRDILSIRPVRDDLIFATEFNYFISPVYDDNVYESNIPISSPFPHYVKECGKKTDQRFKDFEWKKYETFEQELK